MTTIFNIVNHDSDVNSSPLHFKADVGVRPDVEREFRNPRTLIGLNLRTPTTWLPISVVRSSWQTWMTSSLPHRLVKGIITGATIIISSTYIFLNAVLIYFTISMTKSAFKLRHTLWSSQSLSELDWGRLLILDFIGEWLGKIKFGQSGGGGPWA